MHFQRLRLSGFKSFVDVADFRIEEGLTGVVGPNGCGKSNLLEALRWVMGATSAKALRGEGMDDVIFAGADGRPSRNHAEVTLQIDNADRKAPAPFNQHAVIEVSRRIDRGAGSTYRINGVEARARDVQLLFADASTGANSPALVRQGQISELIAAKPSNRRRILEEAAGVAGLHSRRHEADLRLRGAATNLERLDDVRAELENRLNRLKRDARQAERYRRLSAEIRALQGALLHARWREAEGARLEAAAAFEGLSAEAEAAIRAAAAGAVAAERTAAALAPLREAAAVAQTVHQRLLLERDRRERDLEQARAAADRAAGELARLRTDAAREAEVRDDAAQALDRLEPEQADLERALAGEASRGEVLEAALKEAEAARTAADADLVRLAGVLAAEQARREAAEQRAAETDRRRRAALERVEECRRRLARVTQALAEGAAALAAAPNGDPGLAAAEASVFALEAELERRRKALEDLEGARSSAAAATLRARDLERRLTEERGRAASERDGLRGLQASLSEGGFASLLSAVTPERGLEAALAAALGDELEAALDPAAPRFFKEAAAEPPRWPKGATPIGPLVRAPAALAARLAFIALVAAEDGPRLQPLAPVGARLVSREGDLWRWDGYTVRAGARAPAALRLAQKARLEELEAVLAEIGPRLDAARTERRAAEAAEEALASELKAARAAAPAAERALASARADFEARARRNAAEESRREALAAAQDRLKADAAEAAAALAAAEPELRAAEADHEAHVAAKTSGLPDRSALAAAETLARAARGREAAARADREQEERGRAGRRRRREALARELEDWTRRRAQADARFDELALDQERALAALSAARGAPERLGAELDVLIGAFEQAEARMRASGDALAEGERAAAEADRRRRDAETSAGGLREARAAAEARLEAAAALSLAAAEQIHKAFAETPAALAERLRREATATPADAAGVEAHIAGLERERETLGAVNLQAEEEAREAAARLEALLSERKDLEGAVQRLRSGIEELNEEGRERLKEAFARINENFSALFETLFEGGRAELRLVESEDPLEAGLEIYACPPGKRLAAMSLMSGGEQALTAAALIFAVFLSNPAPVCVLDEVDAPLDDANVDRFCRLLDEMRRRTRTRFIVITHNPVTMSRVDRLFGVTMAERGISQLVSVNLRQAEALAAE